MQFADVFYLMTTTRIHSEDEYHGVLKAYDAFTEKSLRSTCIGVLNYCRKSSSELQFFNSCAYTAKSFSKFADNVQKSANTDRERILSDVLNLYRNNEAMETVFNLLYKSEAAKFDAKFHKAMQGNGCSERKAIAMYKSLRKSAKLLELSDDVSMNTNELYLFPDDSTVCVNTYQGKFIVECRSL